MARPGTWSVHAYMHFFEQYAQNTEPLCPWSTVPNTAYANLTLTRIKCRTFITRATRMNIHEHKHVIQGLPSPKSPFNYCTHIPPKETNLSDAMWLTLRLTPSWTGSPVPAHGLAKRYCLGLRYPKSIEGRRYIIHMHKHLHVNTRLYGHRV